MDANRAFGCIVSKIHIGTDHEGGRNTSSLKTTAILPEERIPGDEDLQIRRISAGQMFFEISRHVVRITCQGDHREQHRPSHCNQAYRQLILRQGNFLKIHDYLEITSFPGNNFSEYSKPKELSQECFLQRKSVQDQAQESCFPQFCSANRQLV